MKRPDKFKSAVIQYKSIKGEIEENRFKIKNLCIKALEQEVKLIVLPEMCLTGYIWLEKESIFKLAEENKGESFKFFSDICKKNKCHIAYGFAENDNDNFYNSQSLIGEKGELLLCYRKVHLFLVDEIWALPGNKGFMNIETPLGKMGLGICMDINFDDFVEFHKRNKTDLLLFSSNWLEQNINVHNYWKERLNGFKKTVLISNTFGIEDDIEFCGQSAVYVNNEFISKAPRDMEMIIITEHEVRNSIKNPA